MVFLPLMSQSKSSMHDINLSAALSIFEENIPDIRKACVENIRVVVSKHQPAREMTDDDEMTVDNIWQHVNHLTIKEKTDQMVRILKRIDGRKAHFSKDSITDDDIARAKEKPIEELYDGQLFGRKKKSGLCPFHQERTPSFYIFTKDNRFHCFGCGVHGSSIDFVMKRDGVDFIAAVKSLRGTL